MQVPILVGLLEYGTLNAYQRYSIKTMNVPENAKDPKIQEIAALAKVADKFTFLGCAIFLVIFTLTFWISAQSGLN